MEYKKIIGGAAIELDEDIKKSALREYTQYIEEAYRKANSRIINDIFKVND